MSDEKSEDIKVNPFCKIEKLKIGDKVSVVNYYTIIDFTHDKVKVKDIRGNVFYVGKNIISNEAISADQFTEERKVSRYELARILKEDVQSNVFSCSFTKQTTTKRTREMLDEGGYDHSSNDRPAVTKKNKLINAATVGDKRVMKGFVLNYENLMGRLNVHDTEVDNIKAAKRQVDFRTLDWVIHKNIKYYFKK